MDRQQWRIIQQAITHALRRGGVSRRVVFTDRLILSMYLWSVAHDRPLCWACVRSHYHSVFRPRRLPSVSQFCRRVCTDHFQQLLQHMHDALTADRSLAAINMLDGKALAVGSYSRDPDARRGYGSGRMEKGYKLHALVTQDRRIAAWSVLPLQVHEMNVARVLIDQAVRVPQGAVFLADGNYDAHKLHKDVARRGGWLWARPRGIGQHAVTRRQMGAARRELLNIWQHAPAQAQQIYRQRVHVEGTFSNLTCCGGGLGPLPGFVRRLHRVRRWVGVKIILYHAKLMAKRQQTT